MSQKKLQDIAPSTGHTGNTTQVQKNKREVKKNNNKIYCSHMVSP